MGRRGRAVLAVFPTTGKGGLGPPKSEEEQHVDVHRCWQAASWRLRALGSRAPYLGVKTEGEERGGGPHMAKVLKKIRESSADGWESP